MSSVFAQSIKVQEEVLKMHKQTDDEMVRVKRGILLRILKKIRENPPSFLTSPQPGHLTHTLEELDQTIKDLEHLLQS